MLCGQGEGVVSAGAIINEQGDLRWALVSVRTAETVSASGTGVSVGGLDPAGGIRGVHCRGFLSMVPESEENPTSFFFSFVIQIQIISKQK